MHMKARSSSDLWHITGCSLPGWNKNWKFMKISNNVTRWWCWWWRHTHQPAACRELRRRSCLRCIQRAESNHPAVACWKASSELGNRLEVTLAGIASIRASSSVPTAYRYATPRASSAIGTWWCALWYEGDESRRDGKVGRVEIIGIVGNLPCGVRSFIPDIISSLPASLHSSLYIAMRGSITINLTPEIVCERSEWKSNFSLITRFLFV